MSIKKMIAMRMKGIADPVAVDQNKINLFAKWVSQATEMGLSWSIIKEESTLADLIILCVEGTQVEGFYHTEGGGYA